MCWDLGYVPKGSLRSAYKHYVGTKLASLGDAEGYLRLRRRYYLAEPSVGTLGNKAEKLTRGDATEGEVTDLIGICTGAYPVHRRDNLKSPGELGSCQKQMARACFARRKLTQLGSRQ